MSRPDRRVRTLYLLRHAKSSWDDDRLADRDRPLSRRGERAALAVGQLVRQDGLVLCSNARRARDTLALVEQRLARPARTSIEAGLYLCGADRLLRRLHELDDAVETAMLVGHNPDLHDLAVMLAGTGDAAALRALADKLPTGGLVELTGEGGWPALAAGQMTLRRFVVPKALV